MLEQTIAGIFNQIQNMLETLAEPDLANASPKKSLERIQIELPGS